MVPQGSSMLKKPRLKTSATSMELLLPFSRTKGGTSRSPRRRKGISSKLRRLSRWLRGFRGWMMIMELMDPYMAYVSWFARPTISSFITVSETSPKPMQPLADHLVHELVMDSPKNTHLVQFGIHILPSTVVIFHCHIKVPEGKITGLVSFGLFGFRNENT